MTLLTRRMPKCGRWLASAVIVVNSGLFICSVATADTIQLTLASNPERDGTVTESVPGSGSFDVLETTGISFSPRTNVSTLLSAQRGLLEFDISAIPADSTIDAVRIRLRKGVTLGASSNSVSFLGYPGNGVLEVSDATVAASEMNTIVGFGLAAEDVEYDLGTSVLQSILGTSTFAGIRMQSDDQGAVFNATESTFLDPTLTVEFTPIPEPATFVLLALSGVIFSVAVRRRRNR